MEERWGWGGGGSRRPIVPITDILGLGKHGPLKLSQKHMLLTSKDRPPLSRRCICVCVCARAHVRTSVRTHLPRREINGLEAETGETAKERNVKLISVLQFLVIL